MFKYYALHCIALKMTQNVSRVSKKRLNCKCPVFVKGSDGKPREIYLTSAEWATIYRARRLFPSYNSGHHDVVSRLRAFLKKLVQKSEAMDTEMLPTFAEIVETLKYLRWVIPFYAIDSWYFPLPPVLQQAVYDAKKHIVAADFRSLLMLGSLRDKIRILEALQATQRGEVLYEKNLPIFADITAAAQAVKTALDRYLLKQLILH